MTDDFEMKGENDEADIDLTAAVPLVDDEEGVEEVETDEPKPISQLTSDDLDEPIEEDDEDTDPLDDDFNSEYEE